MGITRSGLNLLPMAEALRRFMKRLSLIPLRKGAERHALKLLRKWLAQGANRGAKKALGARAPAMFDPLFGEEAELCLVQTSKLPKKDFKKD